MHRSRTTRFHKKLIAVLFQPRLQARLQTPHGLAGLFHAVFPAFLFLQSLRR